MTAPLHLEPVSVIGVVLIFALLAAGWWLIGKYIPPRDDDEGNEE